MQYFKPSVFLDTIISLGFECNQIQIRIHITTHVLWSRFLMKKLIHVHVCCQIMSKLKSHKAMSDEAWMSRLQRFASTQNWPSDAGNRPAPRQKKWHDLFQQVCVDTTRIKPWSISQELTINRRSY